MLDYWPWFDKVIAKLPIAPNEAQKALVILNDESRALIDKDRASFLRDRDATCLAFTIFKDHLYCCYEEDVLDKGAYGSGILIYSADFKQVDCLSFNRVGWDLRWRAIIKKLVPK